MLDFEYVKYMGGSTGASLVIRNKEYKILKPGASQEQLYCEIVANKIYEYFDIKVPKCEIVFYKGIPFLMTEFIEGKPLGDTYSDWYIFEAILNGYWIDALLANWDVLGTDKKLSNIIISKYGIYRIDTGGTFIMRARGSRSLSKYESQPNDLFTIMANKSFDILAKNHGWKITMDLIVKYLKKQINRTVTNREYFEIIDALLKICDKDYGLNIDKDTVEYIKGKLKLRLFYILLYASEYDGNSKEKTKEFIEKR